MIYLQLFISFFKIGVFAFGGGYAIITLIQHEIMTYGWMTQSELTDIIAISQMTPGPIGINSATYVGYVASGNIWGAVVATLAITLPSFLIMIAITRFFMVMQKNRYMQYALQGLRPMVVGMIAAAAILLMNRENFIDYKSYILFGLAFVASLFFRVHPILIIIGAGVLGFVLY
ncbi:MAG: chromate transporter [Paludibacter sp.]|nr:chromate transporter [Paludibacter sp.]MDD4427903.1 chromate transporter [Paludibacter sp.]